MGAPKAGGMRWPSQGPMAARPRPPSILELRGHPAPWTLPAPSDRGSRYHSAQRRDMAMAAMAAMPMGPGDIMQQHLTEEESAAAFRAYLSRLPPAQAHSLLLAEMQYRDIGPEDYDLLCELDASVKKPTLSSSALENLSRTSTRMSDLKLGEDDKLCLICHEEYEAEDTVVTLQPCEHSFHLECVREWLAGSSDKCPTCRTAVTN